ncbi:MAG: hypothetical protein O3B75_00255 [Planctomycetota bacterium]|nr:hypothetical protein [Planctomycetota bacterium]
MKILALVFSAMLCFFTQFAQAQILTIPQVSEEANLVIAIEAQSKYDEATALVVNDPEQARELFRESAAKFQRIVDSGVSNGELFFNLGNALVQSDDLGRAIGAYLQAQRLLPGDSRIAANLAHARSLVADGATPEIESGFLDRVASLWKWISFPTRVWGAFIAWTILWGIVVAGILCGWIARVHWRPLLISASAICLGLSLTVGVDAIRREINPPGVLVNDQVVARKGNGDGFAPAFTEPLTRGSEFTMLEMRPGWYRIRLVDGQSGWVKTSDAQVAGELARTSG